jgi:hypothetical protein
MPGGVVGLVLSRLLQAIRLDRDAFVWMDFNDRATGDAAILVAATQVLLSLGTGTSILDLINPFRLGSLLISGLFFWVVYSGAVYGVSKYLFKGHGTYAPVLRITGFAYPTLLIIVFANLFVSSAALVLIIGGAWFVVVVANGMSYVADLAIERAFGAAIGGYVLLVIVQTILSGLRIF